MKRAYLRCLLTPLALLFLGGCVQESPNVVTFDQVLESATFTNRLLTPVAIYRDGAVLDTLLAGSVRVFPINRKGAIRHGWRIIPPLGVNGLKAGIDPYVDLGVQYVIQADYTIDNASVPGRTIFTPRVINSTLWDLQLTANYGESDAFPTGYIFPRNTTSSFDHAPYFYWNSSSNVYLNAVGRGIFYVASRQDTSQTTRLELDDSYEYRGSGLTRPILIY
jgi:hypothetical protein